MKKFILITSLCIFPVLASAGLQSGDYKCNDGGTLSLKQRDLTSYQASLGYPDGSSSTLDVIDFKSTDSMVGTMYPDDDGTIGVAYMLSSQPGLLLRFDGGSEVTCVK